MAQAASPQARLEQARQQYRKALRLVLVLGVVAAISVASQFVSILGAPVGVFPWFLTVVTALIFVVTLVLAQSAKAKRDEAEADAARSGDAPRG